MQQATEERFTPLLSREEHTFSQMRIDRGGPRTFLRPLLPRLEAGLAG